MERTRWLPVWLLVLLLGGAAPLPVRVPAPADRHPEADTSDRLFLWRVTPKAGRNVVYLLGSIHAAAKDFYPLPDEIEDAFAQSKVLAVEVDLAAQDQDALQQLLLDKGTYRDNDSLARHVPQATYERVGKYGAALGLPAMVTDRLRPWALNVLITLLEAQKAGLKPELGVDQHFIDQARESTGKDRKEIVELESADEQLNLLAGFNDKQQADLLDATLDGAGDTKEGPEKLVQAWKDGDADAMHRMTAADPVKKRPALKPVFQKLVDDRNVTMAKKIEGYVRSRKPHFVIVGAGHLSGPNSIPRLLEKRGCKVEQVRRKAAGDEPEPADAPPADAQPKSKATRPLVPSAR